MLIYEKGTVVSQAEDNKGRRARRVPLPGIVLEHLRKLKTFGQELVFPWPHDRRTLDVEFRRLPKSAKVNPDGRDHYTFRDFRRRAGTMNGRDLSALDLQALIDHKDLSTTMKYIRMAHGMEEVVEKINVPEFFRKKAE